MSDIAPRRRRPRTVFHYKVDEDLAPADRQPYLALLRDPRTRIEDAHRWLLERGYAASRSAVARHRRRVLAGEAEHQAGMARALAFARLAGSPDAPDFAAGAERYWQHLVFERLRTCGAAPAGESGGPGPAGAAPASAPTPAELLELGKLVVQCIELTRRRLLHSTAPPPPRGPAGAPAASPPRSDEQLRSEIEDILFRRN